MADMDKPVPCEFEIDVIDLGVLDGEQSQIKDDAELKPQKRPCGLRAKRIFSVSPTNHQLDHAIGINRERALAGTYDGIPSTRGIRR